MNRMFEIEAKVPLTKADLLRVRKKLEKQGKKEGLEVKRDRYYGSESGFFLRVRSVKGRATLTLKDKNTERGIECNSEMEWELSSAKSGDRLLKKLGMKKTAEKRKRCETYRRGALRAEINRVQGLGDFLEIEGLAKNKKAVPALKKKITGWFTELGFTEEQFEKKYYLDLLNHV